MLGDLPKPGWWSRRVTILFYFTNDYVFQNENLRVEHPEFHKLLPVGRKQSPTIKLPGKPGDPGADGYSVPLTSEFLELKKNKFQQCKQQPLGPSRNTKCHSATLVDTF